MAKSKNEETNVNGESEGSLEDAFSGGTSDGAGVFSAWGGQQAATAASVPAPATAPVPAVSPAARPVASYQTEQTITPDGRAPQRKPLGFRVSYGVARRLEKYRKDTDLTVTEVVMLMVDKSVGVLDEMVKHAVQGPKVQTSLFAPQGVAGPPKGTGPEQRQWSPRPEDLEVMKQVVEMAGLPSVSVYIAVALNYCLPEKPCKKD
ncbi:hypothetical protein OG422_31335 (plasmid) [Streptomyces sp. NBC_01525]|uniref:hypothetical protein n=1 Tax=Streptomyces sp. NBC_01525 TaxID=2903893 RepID=UPI002F906B7E